jgi:hypothetical protein
MYRKPSIIHAAGLLALSACASQDASDPSEGDSAASGQTNTDAMLELDVNELARRLDAEGPTEELVGLAKLYNERQLSRRGLVYRTRVGRDHDLMFLEGERGGFVVAERIGLEAADPFLQSDESVAGLSPREIFEHYQPGAEIPQELLDLELHMADAALSAPAGELGSGIIEEDPGLLLNDGPADKHAGDGRHFRDDTHGFDGVSSKGCENSGVDTVSTQCWTDRTGGGFSQRKSTHARYHFALARGNTSFRLKQEGKTVIDQMVFEGEIHLFTSTGPWHCPGLFCAYYGYGAITHRGEWNGSNKTWHFGGHYQDILRKD